MKLLTRTITKCSAASFMLAVWLFVLASGVVNACLLEAPNHGKYQTSSDTSHLATSAPATAHESEHSSKPPCLKACDEGSQALQGSNVMDLVDPGSPPLTLVLWTGVVPPPARPWGFDAPPPQSDPPERIIYSRWAL
jgi:hypothetical protein